MLVSAMLNTIFYLLFVFLLGGMSLVYMRLSILSSEPTETYTTIFDLFINLAFGEIFLIIVFHLWKNFLCNYQFAMKMMNYINKLTCKYSMKKDNDMQLMKSGIYEEYQEELSTIDPNC